VDWQHPPESTVESNLKREGNSRGLHSIREYCTLSNDETALLTHQQVSGCADDDSSALATHRAKVFHAGLLKILESAITAAGEDGFSFGSECRRILAKLVIAILSMDYEEGCISFPTILG